MNMLQHPAKAAAFATATSNIIIIIIIFIYFFVGNKTMQLTLPQNIAADHTNPP